MKTECTAKPIEYHAFGGPEVIGRFDGGLISSDGGGLPLREIEMRTGILARLAE